MIFSYRANIQIFDEFLNIFIRTFVKYFHVGKKLMIPVLLYWLQMQNSDIQLHPQIKWRLIVIWSEGVSLAFLLSAIKCAYLTQCPITDLNKRILPKQAYDLAKWTLSYPPGLDSRYRLHKKAKFCSFMTFSQMTPFFMSHYGNFWQKRVNKCKKSGGYDSF